MIQCPRLSLLLARLENVRLTAASSTDWQTQFEGGDYVVHYVALPRTDTL